jgi:FkbM family methyltransferase
VDFLTFKSKRVECVEWETANGFNEGDSNKNGEFLVLENFWSYFDLFVDIGANNGIFIDRLFVNNDLSKYVLAFEPNPNLNNKLNKKIKKGILIQKALSNKKGNSKFNLYLSDDTTSSLLERGDMMPHFTSKVERIDVELEIFDSFISLILKESSVGIFIKIDAEGVEFPIMEGAISALRTFSNIFLMFEYSKAWKLGGHTLKQAFHYLDVLNFKFYRVTPIGLEALRFYTPDMDGTDYCNYIAIKGIDIGDVLSSDEIRSPTHNINHFYLFK